MWSSCHRMDEILLFGKTFFFFALSVLFIMLTTLSQFMLTTHLNQNHCTMTGTRLLLGNSISNLIGFFIQS